MEDTQTTRTPATDLIRVVVVDDFSIVREGLVSALSLSPLIEVVGQAADGVQALRIIDELNPDVVLLDMNMPVMAGRQVLATLRARPEIRVLVVTSKEDPETLLDAIGEGAAGFLTKRARSQELIEGVVTVYQGGSVITPSLAGHLLKDYAIVANGGRSTVHPGFTEDERTVLRIIARGGTDRDVARELCVSPRTVQNRLADLREKTGLRRRVELARWAAEHVAA